MKLRTRLRRALFVLGGLAILALVLLASQAVEIAAWGIVRPSRRISTATAPAGAIPVTAHRGEVALHGWLLRRQGTTRVPVVFLHGIADNGDSGLGIAAQLQDAGHDVLVFDARGHGSSGGEFCTFGVEESQDLSAMIDAAGLNRVAVLGYSLGGAIGIQAAARDPRIAGLVAVATFADLRSVVSDRAPAPLRGWFLDKAFARAGQVASFDPARASPLTAASTLTVPVLLIHGARDRSTPPHHSERLAAALRSPHRLVLVPGFGHDGVLGAPGVWDEVVRWLASLD